MGAARRNVNPWTWQDNMAFSQATEVRSPGRVVWCAGQSSMDAEGNAVHAGDMAAQITQSLDNLEEVLRKPEMSLSSLVRLNIYTTDIDQFFAAHEVLAKRLSAAGCQPPGSLLGVARLAFPDLLVELEATAAD